MGHRHCDQAVQTNEQQMEQMERRVDAERPPKKPRGRAISAGLGAHPDHRL
jgi:hypothetical protein